MHLFIPSLMIPTSTCFFQSNQLIMNDTYLGKLVRGDHVSLVHNEHIRHGHLLHTGVHCVTAENVANLASIIAENVA